MDKAMDKSIILAVTAIAVLAFADSTTVAMAAEASDQKTRTECTRKRDPARKQWKSECRTVAMDDSKSDSKTSDSRADK